MENIVIGKRVVFGQIVMGIVNLGVYLWNFAHPDNQLPGEIAGFIAQPIIGIGQVWIANKLGITPKEPV